MSDLNQVPRPEVIARLLEERIWSANEDMDALSVAAQHAGADFNWLHEHVFPILVPAIARMLELAEADMKKNKRTSIPVPSKGDSKKKEVVDYGPTGRAHPITWLAEYLLRNSPHHDSTFLENHPYVLVEAAKKQERNH